VRVKSDTGRKSTRMWEGSMKERASAQRCHLKAVPHTWCVLRLDVAEKIC
jgi:hypothetical protein